MRSQTRNFRPVLVLPWFAGVVFFACQKEPRVGSVEIFPSEATIYRGETQKFAATVRDDQQRLMTDKKVSWTSDDEQVATINSQGVATGVGEGVATIEASSGGVSGAALLTVELSPRDRLTGTWNSTAYDYGLFLTTASDQTGFDLFAEGEGVITIRGGYEADLTYMFGHGDGDSGAVFLVTDSPVSPWLEGDAPPPLPVLLAEDLPPADPRLLFMAAGEGGDTLWYLQTPADFVYDPAEGKLSISGVELYGASPAESVTVDGALTYSTVSIPSDTPTEVEFPLLDLDHVGTTFTFEEGGSFRRTTTFSGGGETETAEGLWEALTDTTLRMVEIYLDGEERHPPDTLEGLFRTVSGQRMDMWVTDNLCEAGETYESAGACRREMEALFGLDPGSLVTVQIRHAYSLERSGQGGRAYLVVPLGYRP